MIFPMLSFLGGSEISESKRDSTTFFCDASAVFYQLSYQANLEIATTSQGLW